MHAHMHVCVCVHIFTNIFTVVSNTVILSVEDQVPRIMFEPMREKVPGGLKKLQYVKFHYLFHSPNIFG